MYGRDLNSVLKDNLGDNWDEACATLMCEMRMYELECLRRRMENAAMAVSAHKVQDNNSIMSSVKSPAKSVKSPTLSAKSSKSKSPKSPRNKNKSNRNGSIGTSMKIEDMLDEVAVEEDKFTGHSCLLITWKTNPEVENFKDLYMDKEIKTHKRKNNSVLDPGDLVSEKSLTKNYRIIGKVHKIIP